MILYSITLTYIILYYNVLYYIKAPHFILLPYVILHYFTLHYTIFHVTILSYSTLYDNRTGPCSTPCILSQCSARILVRKAEGGRRPCSQQSGSSVASHTGNPLGRTLLIYFLFIYYFYLDLQQEVRYAISTLVFDWPLPYYDINSNVLRSGVGGMYYGLLLVLEGQSSCIAKKAFVPRWYSGFGDT